ncbi:tRNA (N6-threonylcarbamoyladenosine(37)-N6)-methyltransferase TrmO [Vibrio sp.]|uniref:tRNA (N6-threonylcarbamoyladenosine(37)-N6)-methyltransferase TrmO n=1 Tax=Vibrio sp. TaxID=678 RepID=UPI003D102FFD
MHAIAPIGLIHSPYKEKFAVPRQPRLVPSATARIALTGEANCLEAVRGLDAFSHLWLLFLFDQNLEAGWKPTVRPPRLGGNQRVGVLASRSTFRPNGIGMSAVEMRGICQDKDQIYIDVGSVDLVDGTPIVDIKPYIPYSDAIPDAIGGYAGSEPETLDVCFSASCLAELNRRRDAAHVKAVICEVLAQDPRPAYKKQSQDDKIYSVKLFDLDVKFHVSAKQVEVIAVEYF